MSQTDSEEQKSSFDKERLLKLNKDAKDRMSDFLKTGKLGLQEVALIKVLAESEEKGIVSFATSPNTEEKIDRNIPQFFNPFNLNFVQPEDEKEAKEIKRIIWNRRLDFHKKDAIALQALGKEMSLGEEDIELAKKVVNKNGEVKHLAALAGQAIVNFGSDRRKAELAYETARKNFERSPGNISEEHLSTFCFVFVAGSLQKWENLEDAPEGIPCTIIPMFDEQLQERYQRLLARASDPKKTSLMSFALDPKTGKKSDIEA